MRNTLFLFLAQIRLFWQFRVLFSRLVFSLYRWVFEIRDWIRGANTTATSLLNLLGVILFQLLLAFLTVFGLQITNTFFTDFFTDFIDFFKDKGFTTDKDFTSSTESGYGTLITAFVGAGSVFIGLYYAAISTIGGSIYSRMPNDIRDLLIKEQLGNAYMRLLAWLTFIGLCLLVLHTLGFKPIILAMPLLLLGAGLMVIGFVQLGARAFYLFDPTTLSGGLLRQVQRCYKQVQAGGYRWSDQSFQNDAYKKAQTAINSLTTMSKIVAEEPHLKVHPFAGFCRNLLSSLVRYEVVKKTIPTDSLWYLKRHVHPDWYRTSDTATSLAHETASGLHPESVSDLRWIESAILPIVQHCLEINCKEKRYTIVNELLISLDTYIQTLAEEHQVEYALDLTSKVFSWCKELIFSEEGEVVAEESLEHMQMCELLASMPINTLLAYSRAISAYDQDVIRQRIHRVKWKSKKSIYGVGFAAHVLPRLEWMRPTLELEEKIERRLVSPSWYLQELIRQQEAENLRTVMICVCEKACELYKQWIETSTQHPWLKAVIISRELEYWNKFDHHMGGMNEFWNDLNSDRRVADLPWPSLDIDELKEKYRQRDKELLKLMSEESVLLSLASKSESYPDFSGQFLHTVGEALFSAMCENDCNTVETLFKRYFSGCLLQYENLRPNEDGVDRPTLNNLKIAAAPLLDLMDISGYAYLLSDLHETPTLKEPILTTWDTYLSAETEQPFLQFLAAAVSLSESAFEIGHRSTLRARWKQVIQRLLRDVEREEVDFGAGVPHILFGSETVPIHDSPLVRVFANNFELLSYDGIDIFIALYVRHREAGENLDFGRHRYRDLGEEIRREENRTMEYE